MAEKVAPSALKVLETGQKDSAFEAYLAEKKLKEDALRKVRALIEKEVGKWQ